jgi:hypothetical protein
VPERLLGGPATAESDLQLSSPMPPFAMQQSDAVSAGNWYPLSLFSAPTGGK